MLAVTLSLALLAPAIPTQVLGSARSCEPWSPTDLTIGGLAWSHFVGDVSPYAALGDRGGQVLVSERDNELVLLSSFDSNPPAPIWIVPHENAWPVAAATEADIYLHLDLRMRGFETAGVLKKFTSRSPIPQWSFPFPLQQPLSLVVFDLSHDGQTIVSLFTRDTPPQSELRVHDPSTGQPLQTFILSTLAANIDLSPDGTLAVVGNFLGFGASSVLDISTGAVLFTHRGSPQRRPALSSDGSVLALIDRNEPTTNYVRVFSRTSSGYQLAFQVPTPDAVEPSDVAVSEDGSTVALSWFDTGTPRRTILRAYDVATGTMTMERVQPTVDWGFKGDVAISADGSRFVFGFGGDNSAGVAELAVYRRDSSQPLAEHPLAGPVYSVDMSPDGKRYIASRIEPNGPGFNPSAVELYEVGGDDFAVRGHPSIGASVVFELHGTPGAHATLLRSLALASNPIDVPGVGLLHLDPASITSTSMGIVPPSGPATLPIRLAAPPGMVGRTLYYQGVTTGPRRLTHDWVQLTLVP